MHYLLKSHPVYGRRNINIIQNTCHSLGVMRDWLITARNLITDNNLKQNKQKKNLFRRNYF